MKAPAFLSRLRRAPRAALALLLPLALFLAGWWFGLPPAERQDRESAGAAGVWTCSMHPQIRQPNPGLCPICSMDLIPLEAGADGGGLREVPVSAEAAALLDLRVTPVRRAPADADLRLFGRLDYDERRITAVTARMAGRLDRLFTDFTGTRVRKGDHLAEIYSPELYVAQKELIEARRAFDRLESGASAAVAGTRRRLLDSAREKLRLLQLSPDQIEAIEVRSEPDPTLRIDSPQDGVVVEKLVNEGSYVKTGDRLLRVAELESVWLLVDAYESDLPWIRYGQDVEFTVDSVPGEVFHGRVAFIDPGLDPMRRTASVRVNVPNPRELLKPGVFAKVRIAARMTADGRVIDPSLAGKWISPMHPEIVKDGPGQCDICGMDLVPAETLGFVGEVHESADPLLVPRSAVLRTGDRAIAYVRLPEQDSPVFEGREIVLGPAVGKEFIVREGLSEGELVVTRGAFKLDSELQIKGKPSMMNRSVGLEERPAGKAPDDLAGQWPPVQRMLHRLKAAAAAGDGRAARSHLDALGTIVRSVRTDSLQPAELALWREFSRRLLNALTLAADRAGTAPAEAYGIAARAIEEAGRYLGLPYRPLEPPAGDPARVGALRRAVDAYLPLAKALAADDDAGAQAAAAAMAKGEIPAGLLESARAVAAAPDLKPRRAAFRALSDALVAEVRADGIDRLGDLYVVHCPMAFGNTGADWLSAVPQVLNPYFGDAMLTCGTVTDTLSVGERKPAAPEHPPGHDH